MKVLLIVLFITSLDRLNGQVVSENLNDNPGDATSAAAAAANTQKEWLSVIQLDYLSAVERFWNQIEELSHTKSDENAQQRKQLSDEIVATHRNIFFGPTRDTTSYWRAYLLYHIGNLRDHLDAINGTLEENYGHLYGGNDRVVYDPKDIELWTQPSMFRRLKENSDGLFQLSQQTDIVFQHIRNV